MAIGARGWAVRLDNYDKQATDRPSWEETVRIPFLTGENGAPVMTSANEHGRLRPLIFLHAWSETSTIWSIASRPI
jgi:hypothetical protein